MNRISEAGDGEPVGSTAEKSDDLHDGNRGSHPSPASGPDVTSSQGVILDIESIEWIAVANKLPDSDTTVLVFAPAALDEPVWLGYHDGETWVSVTGAMYSTEDEITASVQAWAPIPKGPG